MATVETRTLVPMTMVPEASSMTTRATWSGSTRNCSISARNPTGSRPAMASTTVRGSVAVAAASPVRRLMAAATRRAVVRSGIAERQPDGRPPGQRDRGTSRSTMAPLDTGALVGTPRCTLPAAPRAATAPVATAPWATA